MRVRLAQTVLFDDLISYLQGRGFVVTRRNRHEVEAHPLNPVNDRYDREKTAQALREWHERHPRATLEY